MRHVWMLVVSLALAGSAGADGLLPAPSPTRFRIQSEFGKEADWVEGYLGRAARVLVRMMDAPTVPPPKEIAVALKKDPASRGVGGGATTTSLSFTSNVWPEDQWRHWILVHELVNAFAAHYAGSGGMPSDWWSNGRSPFPTYACCLVLAQLGNIEDAAWLKGTMKGKADHELYWVLHRKYGFELFARFLALLRGDGIDLGKIGAPWPAADAKRSLYTAGYLSIAAGENLALVLSEHGIGKKPSDWDQIHPEKPFVEYEMTKDAIDALVATRKRLFDTDAAKNAKLDPERTKFRAGSPSPR